MISHVLRDVPYLQTTKLSVTFCMSLIRISSKENVSVASCLVIIMIEGGELAQLQSTHQLIQRSPVQFRARSHTWVMDYERHVNASYSWSGPQLPKGCGCIGFLSLTHRKIPDSYSKREGGNPGNSYLSSQQLMVVHYPRTVCKNSYAEHEVTGRTYNH